MDRVTKATRSKIMASVPSRNTSPELAVRSMVHRLGYRYSLARNDLPGKPDMAFVCRRRVIFVHGCFCHGHSCRHGRMPKSRRSYWTAKIAGNKTRDRRQSSRLRKLGWSVMIVWQCQLKLTQRLEGRIRRFLDG